MADRSLSFNVAAIDRASKSFEKIALRIERLEGKLDRLDAKRVDVDVDVDTDKAERKIRRFTKRIGDTFGALPSRLRGILITGLFAGIVAAAPVAGAIAASALVLAFGAGLAILPTIVAAHNKKVRKSFSDLADHVKPIAKRISQPFVPALQHVAKVAQDTFDSFAPALRKSFADLGPDLSLFADDLSDAFKAFKPAIKPITKAFGDILGAIGPKLPGLFGAIGDAMADLAKTVSKHKELFATVFVGLLHVIPIAIRLVNFLAVTFAAFAEGARVTGVVAAGAFLVIIKGARFMVDSVLSFLGLIVHGAAKAFGWIPGLGPKLKSAAGKFDSFRARVDNTFNSLSRKARGFKRSLDRIPKVVKLKGNIQDLKQKIRKAKGRLKDPDLTRPEKSKIRANIAQLRRKVNVAKAELRGIHDRTVNVWVNKIFTARNAGGHPHRTYSASGGLIRGRGSGTSDSIPRWLSNGEYVVRAASVKRVGTAFLAAVNRGGSASASNRPGHAASGGVVQAAGQGDRPVFVTVELDGAPIAARIRAAQDDRDHRTRRRILAGSGARV
ncbi:MAG: hypothetical protein ACRDMV_06125 [Streptosporangiales bacterium]